MPTNNVKISAPPPTTAKEKKTTAAKKSTWPGVIALLSLLLMVMAIGAAYYLYQKDIQDRRLVAEKQAIDIEMALAETQKIVIAQEKTLADIQVELKNYQRGEKNGEEYLNEAEHLVRLAMFMLIFEGDTTTVYQLLQTADEKMQIMDDTTVTWPIRQALAKDIVAVQVVHRVDLPGLISHLNALSVQVESLPRSFEPTEALTASSSSSADASTDKSAATWKEKLNKTGSRITQILGGLFVISRDVPKAAPLLPPDQYIYIITNIQAQLAMAEWAVLYRQPKIYQESLTQAETWIRRYFAENHSDTQAFLTRLDRLMAISVKPDLPDLTESLKQIELARKKGAISHRLNVEEKPKTETVKQKVEEGKPPTEEVQQHMEEVREQTEQTENVRRQQQDAEGLGI